MASICKALRARFEGLRAEARVLERQAFLMKPAHSYQHYLVGDQADRLMLAAQILADAYKDLCNGKK